MKYAQNSADQPLDQSLRRRGHPTHLRLGLANPVRRFGTQSHPTRQIIRAGASCGPPPPGTPGTKHDGGGGRHPPGRRRGEQRRVVLLQALHSLGPGSQAQAPLQPISGNACLLTLRHRRRPGSYLPNLTACEVAGHHQISPAQALGWVRQLNVLRGLQAVQHAGHLPAQLGRQPRPAPSVPPVRLNAVLTIAWNDGMVFFLATHLCLNQFLPCATARVDGEFSPHPSTPVPPVWGKWTSGSREGNRTAPLDRTLFFIG